LLLLADRLGRADTSDSRLLAELLADAAVAAMGGGEVVRHRGVAGATSEIGRRLPFDAIRRAALKAADAPPDTRRGNRRLHFEHLLIQLYLSAGCARGAAANRSTNACPARANGKNLEGIGSAVVDADRGSEECGLELPNRRPVKVTTREETLPALPTPLIDSFERWAAPSNPELGHPPSFPLGKAPGDGTNRQCLSEISTFWVAPGSIWTSID
jgi:hypothetical protein